MRSGVGEITSQPEPGMIRCVFVGGPLDGKSTDAAPPAPCSITAAEWKDPGYEQWYMPDGPVEDGHLRMRYDGRKPIQPPPQYAPTAFNDRWSY